MIRTVAGALALVLFLLLGDAITRWFGLPVPGALIGMVLLLLALIVRGRTPAGLEAACTLGTALTLVVTAMTLRWSLRRMGQEPPR